VWSEVWRTRDRAWATTWANLYCTFFYHMQGRPVPEWCDCPLLDVIKPLFFSGFPVIFPGIEPSMIPLASELYDRNVSACVTRHWRVVLFSFVLVKVLFHLLHVPCMEFSCKLCRYRLLDIVLSYDVLCCDNVCLAPRVANSDHCTVTFSLTISMPSH